MFIHTVFNVPTKFQNQTNQSKTKLFRAPRTGHLLIWNTYETPKTLKLTFIVTKNLNKTRYFYSYKALKTSLAVISTTDSFILKFGEQYKKSNRDHDMISYTFNSPPAKAQKSTRNNFRIVFVQIPDTHKKYQLSQNIF